MNGRRFHLCCWRGGSSGSLPSRPSTASQNCFFDDSSGGSSARPWALHLRCESVNHLSYVKRSRVLIRRPLMWSEPDCGRCELSSAFFRHSIRVLFRCSVAQSREAFQGWRQGRTWSGSRPLPPYPLGMRSSPLWDTCSRLDLHQDRPSCRFVAVENGHSTVALCTSTWLRSARCRCRHF